MDPNIIWDAWVGILTLLWTVVILLGLIVGAIGRIWCWFQLKDSRAYQNARTHEAFAEGRAYRRDLPTLIEIRRSWPGVLDRVRDESQVAWLAFRDSTPNTYRDGVLTVGMTSVGSARNAADNHRDDVLREAIAQVIAVDVTITMTINDSALEPVAFTRTTG